MNREEFVASVIDHMTEEHGCSASTFDSLKPRIEAAYEPEGLRISADEMSAMAHGEADDGGGTAKELEDKYPQLAEIFVLAYTHPDTDEEVEDDSTEEEDDDDEDEDEDEEEEDGDDD